MKLRYECSNPKCKAGVTINARQPLKYNPTHVCDRNNKSRSYIMELVAGVTDDTVS